MRFSRVAALAASIAVAWLTASVVPAGADAATATGSLRICTGCSANSGDLSRYGWVVLHAWDHGRIAELKAANPQIKILVYKNMSATYGYAVRDGRDQALLPAGVGYRWASQNRPDWFARDAAGRPVEFADYRDLWLMDVGNPDYQSAWLANVADELRRHAWDGVMIDDVNVSSRWHLGDRRLAKYPTDEAWAAATRSFLARVGPALKGQGRLVIPNIYTEWPSGPKVWKDWIQFTSGGVQEYWTKWGSGSEQHFGGADWAYRQRFLSLTQSAGKTFLGITYAPMADVHSMRYARASFLLDWNGGSSALVFQPTGPEAQAAYSPEWAAEIGVPVGTRVRVGAAWRRNYSEGAVLVNPSDSPQRVELGETFLLPDGSGAASVTLAAKSGLVLRSREGARRPQSRSGLPADPAWMRMAGRMTTKERSRVGRAVGSRPRVSLRVERRITGRVLVRTNVLRRAQGRRAVTVYRWTGGGWRIFGRAQTDRAGRFHVRRPVRSRAGAFRAVARFGGITVRSRILRLS